MNPKKPLRVLFLCTGNSARSVLGEFLLRHRGEGAFETHSAGSHPSGAVNPYTLRVLRECYRIDASGARSKSVEEFIGQPFDFVITVCDNARQTCPIWPARTVIAHWSMPDPALFQGSDQETFDFFAKVALQIKRRVDLLCALPLSTLNHDRRERASKDIGEQGRLTEQKQWIL
jgi:protein-tyrosine-phosphatase